MLKELQEKLEKLEKDEEMDYTEKFKLIFEIQEMIAEEELKRMIERNK